MTQDQILMLLSFKESKENGAASMTCGARLNIVSECVDKKWLEPYGAFGGFRITDVGIKALERTKRKVK